MDVKANIEVTDCNDCPFVIYDKRDMEQANKACSADNENRQLLEEEGKLRFPNWCPLRQFTINITLK